MPIPHFNLRPFHSVGTQTVQYLLESQDLKAVKHHAKMEVNVGNTIDANALKNGMGGNANIVRFIAGKGL